MKYMPSWSTLMLVCMCVVGLLFTQSTVQYCREALSNRFTGVATTKVIASAFLAVVVWIDVLVYRLKRRDYGK